MVGVSMVDLCSFIAGGICETGVSSTTVGDLSICDIRVSSMIYGDSESLLVFIWLFCCFVSIASVSDSICSVCCCISSSCLGRAC